MGRFSELGFPAKHGIPENSCFDDRQTTAEGCYEVCTVRQRRMGACSSPAGRMRREASDDVGGSFSGE